MKIKALFCDVDGTMTDGGIYVNASGGEAKRFSCKDGAGFHLLRKACPGIVIGMITGEKGGVNEARAKKLKVDYFVDGVNDLDKLNFIKKICFACNIELSEVAYIGDDHNDLEALRAVGWPFCPEDAHFLVKNACNKIETNHKGSGVSVWMGGHGAVRWVCERIIEINKGDSNGN